MSASLRRRYAQAWHRLDPLDPGPGAALDPVALESLGRGGALVDVGSGRGRGADALAERFARVVRVDVSATALGRRRGGGDSSAVVADLDAPLPFAPACFDAALALDVIEHLFDAPFLVSELARVLAPDGRLLLETPNARWIGHLRSWLRGHAPDTVDASGRLAGLPTPHRGHISPFTGPDLERLLVASGFEIVSRTGFAWTGGTAARIAAWLFGPDMRAQGLRVVARRDGTEWVPRRVSELSAVVIDDGAGSGAPALEALPRVEGGLSIVDGTLLPANGASCIDGALAAAHRPHVLVLAPRVRLAPGGLVALRSAFDSDPAVAVAVAADGALPALVPGACLVDRVALLAAGGFSPDVAVLGRRLASRGRVVAAVPCVAARVTEDRE